MPGCATRAGPTRAQGAGTWTAAAGRALTGRAGCPAPRPADGVDRPGARGAGGAAAGAGSLRGRARRRCRGCLPEPRLPPAGCRSCAPAIAERYTDARRCRRRPSRCSSPPARCMRVAVAVRDGGAPRQPGAGRAPDVPERAGRDPGASGRRPVPVSISADDPDGAVRDLTRAARETAPRAAYLMPDFHNPTGMLLDPAAAAAAGRGSASRRASWPSSTRPSSTSGWTSRRRHRSRPAPGPARSSRWAR